jgi:hypothetical protein
MSKYRKAVLIWVVSVVLTITGFSICGPHRSSHHSNQTGNMAPPSPAAIEVGSLVKSEEQPCWHPGLARNIGIAELSCNFLERQIPPGRNGDSANHQ